MKHVSLTVLLARSWVDIQELKAAVANPLTIFGQREAILGTDWLDFIWITSSAFSYFSWYG